MRRPALTAVYQVLARCGVGREHADEALQMAYLNFLARGLEQYDGKASPATYFSRIAVRCAIDVVRRLRRDVGNASWEETPGISEAAPLPHKGRPSLRPTSRRAGDAKTAGVVATVDAELRSDPASRARTAEALYACVGELNPMYFEAISLYCLEEVGDHATCAKEAGVSTDAFMQRLCRARLQLAECLAARLGIRRPLPPGRARPPHDPKVRLP